MKSKIGKIVSAIVVTSLTLSIANKSIAEEQIAGKGFFAFLAPMLIDTLKQVVTGVVQQGSNTIFQKINSIGQTTPIIYQNSPPTDQQYKTQPIIQPQQAQTLSQQPLVAITVTKYANKNINSPIIETVNFPANSEIGFSINTGEAFAVKFDTSLPGRVRITNIDAYGKIDGPWDYDVIGAAENRLPKSNNIEMIGAPGVENMEIQFIPCVSPTKVNDSRVAPYINILPSCSASNQSFGSQAKSMKRVIKTKSMSNDEANLNPGVVLMAGSPELPVGTTQTFRVRVNHVMPNFQVPATQQQAVPEV